MSYDPLEPDIRDKIRRLVRDHSDDEEEEYFPDDTYDRVIAQHTNWKRACAEMALSVAGVIEDDPSSMGSDGDSMSWTQRTKSLYAIAAQMTAEADEEDAAAPVAAAPAFAYLAPPVDWR